MRRPPTLPLVLAVLGPACVWALAAWMLTRELPASLGPRAKQHAADLARLEPEVVVISNSHGGWGVAPERLGERLGVGADGAALLWSPGVGPAAWYAMLEHRVRRGGHRPRLVVVVGNLDLLLLTELYSDWEVRDLQAQAAFGDPVLERVLGRGGAAGGLATAVRRNRLVIAERVVSTVKYAAVGLTADREPDEALLAAGQRVGAPALARVFAERRAGEVAAGGAPGGAASLAFETRAELNADAIGGVQEGFVPELARVARELGARLVFATIPFAPGTDEGRVPPERERELIAALAERGVGYADLRELELGKQAFFDATHLSEEGRALYTDALADALLAMDALGTTPFAPTLPARLVASPEIVRLGSAPTLEPVRVLPTGSEFERRIPLAELAELSERALERVGPGFATPVRVLEDGVPLAPAETLADTRERFAGRSRFPREAVLFSPSPGSPEQRARRTYAVALADEVPLRTGERDAYWLFAGTGLAVRFDGEVSRAGARRRLEVWIHPLAADGSGAPRRDLEPVLPEGSCAGEPLRFERRARGLYLARAPVPATGERFELELRAPSGGAHALLRGLFLVDPIGTVAVVGSREELDVPEVDLFAYRYRDLPVYGEPPAPVPVAGFVPLPNQPHAGLAHLPELAHLSDAAVREHTLTTRCSPVVVFEGGRPLVAGSDEPPPGVDPLVDRYLLRNDYLWVGTLDGTHPWDADKRYAVGFDADRRLHEPPCWWLYAGDRARFQPDARYLERLRPPVDELELEGWAFGPADERPLAIEVELELEVDGQRVLDARIDARRLRDGPLRLPLERPITSPAAAVALTLHNASERGFVLLERGELMASDEPR